MGKCTQERVTHTCTDYVSHITRVERHISTALIL
jgi:hypothetical protein